jgi:hypothetical protein
VLCLTSGFIVAVAISLSLSLSLSSLVTVFVTVVFVVVVVVVVIVVVVVSFKDGLIPAGQNARVAIAALSSEARVNIEGVPIERREECKSALLDHILQKATSLTRYSLLCNSASEDAENLCYKRLMCTGL